MKQFGTKFNKEKKQLFKTVGSFAVLGLVAVICFITAFAWFFNTDVFGWIVSNKTPVVNGTNLYAAGEYAIDLGVKTQSDAWVEYDRKILTVDFDDIFCGTANSKKLQLSIGNTESKDLFVSWYFGMPYSNFGGEEAYIQKDDGFYYLGSQLMVSDITATVKDTNDIGDGVPVSVPMPKTPGKGKFLVQTSPQNGGQVLYTDTEVESIPRLDLIKGLVLPAGKTTTITITFTFADNGEDQSFYQNFTGKCSRTLYYKALEHEES